MSVPEHPAKFSDAVLGEIQRIVDEYLLTPEAWDVMGTDEAPWVLDAFAGTGKIHALLGVATVGVELEEEWAEAHLRTIVGDALNLRASGFYDKSVAGWIASIVFGNRMSDHHEAKDDSVRNTYRHKLGRALHPNNSGQLHFHQPRWKSFHHEAFAEADRVASELIVVNIKNFLRGPELMRPVEWVIADLIEQGCGIEEVRRVKVSGNGFGQNGQRRVGYEHLVIARPSAWMPPLPPKKVKGEDHSAHLSQDSPAS